MKKEKWQRVVYIDPDTKLKAAVESRAGCCPNCGQSPCTRRNATCLAVQEAIKRGFRTFFSA